MLDAAKNAPESPQLASMIGAVASAAAVLAAWYAGRAGEDEGVLQQADVVGDLAGADHGFLLLFLRATDGGLRGLLHLAAHHAAGGGGAGEGAFGRWCPLAGCCGGGVTEGDVARALLAETLC